MQGRQVAGAHCVVQLGLHFRRQGAHYARVYRDKRTGRIDTEGILQVKKQLVDFVIKRRADVFRKMNADVIIDL